LTPDFLISSSRLSHTNSQARMSSSSRLVCVVISKSRMVCFLAFQVVGYGMGFNL